MNALSRFACWLPRAVATLVALAGAATPQVRIEDPSSWSRFDAADGLPDGAVHALVELDGVPWVAGDGGLARFDGWRWREVGTSRGLPAGPATELSQDPNGRLWVVVNEALFRGGAHGFDPIRLRAPYDVRPVGTVVHTTAGEHLISVHGSEGWEVLALDDADRLEPIPFPIRAPFSLERILFMTESGRIWIVLQDGVYVRDVAGGLERFLPIEGGPVELAAIVESPTGEGMLGFRDPVRMGGLWTWDDVTPPARVPSEGRATVRAIAKLTPARHIVVYESGQVRVQRAGDWHNVAPIPAGMAAADWSTWTGERLWIGGAAGLSVYRVENPRWRELRTRGVNLAENRINEIVLGTEGIWTASHGGVHRFEPSGERVALPPVLDDRLVDLTGLALDPAGRVWTSSGSFAGVFRYEGDAWTHLTECADGTPIGTVHKIRSDPDGRLWFCELSKPGDLYGPSGRLLLWENGELNVEPRFASLALETRVYDATVDENDRVWVAHNLGVTRINVDGTTTSWAIAPKTSLYAQSAMNVALGPGGRVWFSGRRTVGWIDLDDELHHLDGFPAMESRDLAIDNAGRVWATTSDGLYLAHRGEVTRLGHESGLSITNLWPIVLTEETALVGSLGLGVQLLSLSEERTPPPRVEIGAPALEPDGAYRLTWTANSWWARTPPEQVRTRWRINEGPWSPWAETREVRIADASSGTHTFEVEGMSLLGVRSATPAQAGFEVPPPLYLRPQVLVPIGTLAALLVILSVASVARLRRGAADLRRSVLEQRSLFEGAHDPILVVHAPSMVVRDANVRAVEMFGTPVDELRGRMLEELLEGFSHGIAAMPDAAGRLVSGLRARPRTGPPVDVEAGMRLVSADRGLVILRDLSERKRLEAERQAFEEEVAESQRLEGLGRLAGGVAHDFNNLLMIVGGSVDQARREIAPGSTAASALDRIQTSVARAGDLTQQLLAFAGRGRLRPRPVDLNALAAEMVQLSRSSMPRGATLTTALHADLPLVDGDPTGLHQVLLNLILNGADAVGGSPGTVEVATRVARTDDLVMSPTGWADAPPDGRWVVLEVTDDGVGMDSETRRRAFDPFYSTKTDGRGLGLAAVRGIVRSLAGFVRVVSHPGAGTRVTILLPVSADVTTESAPEPVADETLAGGLILVVDDEAGVRQVLEAMLTDLGFDVIEADGGAAAIELHTRRGEEIVATLLDLSMPGMGGLETRAGILAQSPSARVIFMSGYTEVADPEMLGQIFLQKPFLRTDVIQVLKAIEVDAPQSSEADG